MMSRRGLVSTILSPILVLLLVGCGSAPGAMQAAPRGSASAPPPAAALLPVTVTETAMAQPQPCTGTFVAHTLDHTTAAHGNSVRLYDSNGAGVAVNDLDGDGRLDLVLANLNGPATILWNQGNYTFRKEPLPDVNTRAVNIVDVDGDGRPDIVFTHSTSSLSHWHNEGEDPASGRVRFTQEPLPNVLVPAYTMAWGDLSGHNSLDLVTASYDAELEKVLGDSFRFGAGAGVYFYEHRPSGNTGNRLGTFVAQRLARQSQALAVALFDLNGDGQADIVVGNDFGFRDQAWQRVGAAWMPTTPFPVTTYSTMSFDWGDVDNSGRFAFFATDMKPYDTGVETLASWLPIMATMPHPKHRDDTQIMENVLQVPDAEGRFQDQALEWGVDATGWSWSGKFGDVDNDGFLDLYVVNGMIATELFPYLPGNELVEQNQAFRNDGSGHFERTPAWGLGSTASGRGMTMADLNNDGNLDIVVNNLQSPALLFENRLCGGASLEVDLFWPKSGNTRAIGAQLVLHTSTGTYSRDVRSGSGYLSGDPTRVHFGFPANAVVERLDIVWPDGRVSSIERPVARTLLEITR